MRKLVLITGLCGALAACNQPSVSLTNVSADEVEKQTKAAGLGSQIKAGEWETKVDLLDIEMPGINPAMKAEMLKRAKETKVHSYCISEEEAKRPGGIFTGNDTGECTYSKFEMSAGKVDITMVCPGQSGGKMTMHVAGTFSADTIAAVSEMKGEGQFPMQMKANVNSRRLGECKTGSPKK